MYSYGNDKIIVSFTFKIILLHEHDYCTCFLFNYLIITPLVGAMTSEEKTDFVYDHVKFLFQFPC